MRTVADSSRYFVLKINSFFSGCPREEKGGEKDAPRLRAWRLLLGFSHVFTPRLLLATLLFAVVFLPAPPNATALTEEEKRAAFMQTQQSGDAQPKSTPATESKKKAKKSKAKPKPHSKKRQSTPEPPPRGNAEPAKTPEPPTPAPTPLPTPGTAVVVEKSGAAEEEATPTPVPEKTHWWWPFGSSTQYKYLTPAVRRAIDNAHVASHRWRYIVVHNSGTTQGNAKAFDYYHRHVRKMPNGLAYHFVIGNGTSSGNGAIEIGPRWSGQINGGHVHSDYLNSIALGICLVGDYNRDKPTKQQLEALDELIRFLRNRVGKTDHKLAIVKPHRDINPPQWPTDCPGNRFPYPWLQSHFE